MTTKTTDDLTQAINLFNVHPTSHHADVVQGIGLELWAAGEIEMWEFRLLCTNLF